MIYKSPFFFQWFIKFENQLGEQSCTETPTSVLAEVPKESTIALFDQGVIPPYEENRLKWYSGRDEIKSKNIFIPILYD